MNKPSDLNMEVYELMGLKVKRRPSGYWCVLSDTGVTLGKNYVTEEQAWLSLPKYETDLNAAFKLWDGFTTWGHIYNITVWNQSEYPMYYRAFTSGSGMAGSEAEHIDPATAITISWIEHTLALRDYLDAHRTVEE